MGNVLESTLPPAKTDPQGDLSLPIDAVQFSLAESARILTSNIARYDAERQNRDKIVDETGGKKGLSVVGFIQSKLKHDSIDDSH